MSHVDLCARGYMLSAMPSNQSAYHSCARQRLSGSQNDRIVSTKSKMNATSIPVFLTAILRSKKSARTLSFQCIAVRFATIWRLVLASPRKFACRVHNKELLCLPLLHSILADIHRVLLLSMFSAVRSAAEQRASDPVVFPLGRGPTGRTPHC